MQIQGYLQRNLNDDLKNKVFTDILNYLAKKEPKFAY